MELISFFIKRAKLVLFLALFLFSIFSSILIVNVSSQYNSDNSLTLLANQFLIKHISLDPTNNLPLGDLSFYQNKYYLYFAPLPSIILMPFALILKQSTPQIILGIISLAVTFFTIYSISKAFKFSSVDSLWVSLFFVFSTVLFSSSLINISAYQVEVLTVPLIALALREYFYKRRPMLIGIFLGFAVLTRVTMILAIIFFLVEFFAKRISRKQFLYILFPVLIACVIYGTYNQIRFNAVLETGYKYATAYKTYPQSMNYQYGLFSPTHIPANLYSFLLMAPEPLLQNEHGFVLKFPYLKVNPWGLAIWFTSPLFLLLLFKFRKSKYTTSAFITFLALALPIFLYYSIGFSQFGYRYALDFLPFLFLLLIPTLLPRLSKTAIILITMGVIFNCFYITSLWGRYPHFGS